jgi:hypothetical protein
LRRWEVSKSGKKGEGEGEGRGEKTGRKEKKGIACGDVNGGGRVEEGGGKSGEIVQRD